VRLNRRAGARIYLRVSGTLRNSLEYHLTGARYHGGLNPFGGSIEVSYSVRNTGNTLVAGEHRTTVGGPLQGAHLTDPVPIVLPGSEVRLTSTVHGVRAFGHLTVRTDLVGGKDTTDTTPVFAPVSAERGVWAISWPWLLLLVVILVVAAIWILRLVLRRRTRPPAQLPVREPASL
jgi:hypothetical protein